MAWETDVEQSQLTWIANSIAEAGEGSELEAEPEEVDV